MRSNFIALLAIFAAALSGAPKSHAIDVWDLKKAVSFEPNLGQTASEVRYVARTSGGLLFFTTGGMVLEQGASVLRFDLLGADPNAVWEGADPSGATTSYYIGRNPKNWAENVPHYRRLTRHQIYPGIDVVYYGNGNRLEYDFIVAPDADASRIRIRADGARRISIGRDGTLTIETAAGALVQHQPVIFQVHPDGSKRTVKGSFRLFRKNEIGFRVGAYDRSLPLFIDPVLESSTYVGGSGDDSIVATDGNGTIVGNTTSIDFPGASLARRLGQDILVQLGSSGQTLVIGGSGDDIVTSAGFTGIGTVVIGGYTNSQDLPTNLLYEVGYPLGVPWQPDFAGGATDGFVMLIIPNSDVGPFLSYVGTAGDDRITAVAGNPNGADFVFVGTTNGNGLLQTEPFYLTPSQPNPAGGVDGFIMAAAAYPGTPPALFAFTYLGGSGDDTPYGVAYAPSGQGYYVVGETTSPDFPLVKPLYSQRSGASDAFITLISPDTTIAASTLLGGSGTDRAVSVAQLSLSNQSVFVAGVTSSPDLPLTNPVQPAFGGGPADAFLAQFAWDLSKIVSCTYYGGSGDEEVSSVAVDSIGNVFLGGWTTSTDFPVRNALQPAYGGGPDDGFLVHFDTDGSVSQATYFGGSGSDRILSLSAPTGPAVFLVGTTTSPDLPLVNPSQAALKGSSDGFLARISENTFSVGTTLGGKDLRIPVTLFAGISAAANAVVTIASSDTSKVTLAANTYDTGAASTQITLGSTAVPNGTFYMDCLDDNGGATLTISAPGLETRMTQATCTETHIQTSPGNPDSVQLWLFNSGNSAIAVSLVALDPNTLTISAYGSVRPGAQAITVQVDNSNPAAGTVQGAPLTFVPDTATSNTYNLNVLFTPLSVGTTELTFSSPSLKPGPYDQMSITVTPPIQFSASSLNVPVGFQALLPLSVARYAHDPTISFTITSQDAAKLLLSLDPQQTGSASITIPYLQYLNSPSTVYLQALSAGDTTIALSVPGTADVSTSVHTAPPIASLAGPTQISAAVGEFVDPTPQIGVAGTPFIGLLYANPGQSFEFTLANSNPSVVAVTTGAIQVNSTSPVTPFQATAAKVGTANLTLQAPAGITLSTPAVISVTVTPQKPPQMKDIEVGKDLTGTMSLIFSAGFPPGSSVTLTSSNPGIVLLSSDGQSAGQPQITIPSGGATGLQFYVYGLASSGQATITAASPGIAPATATVHLDPSGFGWNLDQLSEAVYAQSTGVNIVAFALDPASLLPVASQWLRPGVSATVGITNSNSGAVATSLSSLSFPLPPSGSPYLTITGLAPGTATLGITEPNGFSTPSIRQQLTVQITTSSLHAASTTIGKNTETTLQLTGPAYPVSSQPLTVRSGDPSKLLVSTDPNALGTGSVTIPAGSPFYVYLEALDSVGTVIVTVSQPGFNDGTATVTLTGSAFILQPVTPSGSIAGATAGTYNTTIQSPKTHIYLQIVMLDQSGNPTSSSLSLRGGLAVPSIEVTSSNPAAGQIVGSPAMPATGVDFVPAGIGQTTVSVTQPPGFSIPASGGSLTFNVGTPALTANNLVLGKDTFSNDAFGVAQNVTPPATNVPVTITSSDPSRVLLSPDPNTAATASINITLPAHFLGGSFYVHAIANNGTVPVSIAASGYATSSFNVALTDLLFTFEEAPYNNVFSTTQQPGEQQWEVTTLVSAPGYNLSRQLIRPGIPDVIVNVASTNAAVIAIDNPQLDFKPGFGAATLTYRTLAAGQATISLNPPSGYLADPAHRQIDITVTTPAEFNDVSPSDGFFEAANLMFEAGVTTGCVTGTSPASRSFCAGDTVTREEMAAFIVRAVTRTTNPISYNYSPYFTDVPASNPFFAHIQKLMDLGITTGCAPNLFCPTDVIPRWEMAIFMIRARLALYGANFSTNPAPYFSDVPINVEGNGAAFPFIQRLYEEHVTAGCSTSPMLYCPDQFVTRGEMALFMMRALFNDVMTLPNVPLLVGVDQNTMDAVPGRTVTVTITGANTNFQSGDTVSVPSGMLTVSNVVVNSATSITATLTAAANIVAGPQALVVTTGGQNLTLPLAMKVGFY